MVNSVKLPPKELKEYNFPSAQFFTKEQQKTYEEACKQFNSEKAKQSLTIPEKGSNLFKVLLLNQIGIRTASLPELDLIVNENPEFLKDHYEDSPSVVLRSNGDSYAPNNYLAKSLSKIIKKRTFKEPIVINCLKIKEDNNSSHGLGFEEGDNFGFFKAPELDYANNQKRFSKLDERGIPVFDKEGKRTFHAKKDGLSRLGLHWGLGLASGWYSLAGSSSDGRVVTITSRAGSQKILDEYVNKLAEKKEKRDSSLKVRYDEASKILDNAYNQAKAILTGK